MFCPSWGLDSLKGLFNLMKMNQKSPCELAAGKNPKWDKLVAPFTKPVAGSEIRPDKKAAKVYDRLLEKYAVCESEAIAGV